MIAVAGINYKTAGFEKLARFSGGPFVPGNRPELVSGQVWVETCNRVEVYADLNLHCKKSAERLLLELLGLKMKEPGIYVHFEDEAMLHLLKVSAGLDSAILGEDQVLSQLKSAFQIASDKRQNSPFLNKVFHKAFETGKLVRTLTSINKGHISAASIAVTLLESFTREYTKLKSAPILIIGAGETGSLITEILSKKGYKNLFIWNRSAIKATNLAKRTGGIVIPHNELEVNFMQAGAVIIAVSGKKPVLDFSGVTKNKAVKQLIIDLSLPYQVPAEIENKNTFLYNLDHIAAISKDNEGKRKEAIEDAMQLVWAALYELKAWKEQEWVGQTLQQWKIMLDQLQERQLKSFIKKFPDADPDSLAAFGREMSANMLKQLAWTIRQQEKEGSEWQKWSKLLSTVEPYEQLN
jgi:glutamyl-tRNA reductase